MVRAAATSFPLPEPVLELGSYIVPGQEAHAVRPLLGELGVSEFLGVDQRKGPGVDQVADGQALPFGDASFGCVVALSVLEHVERFWLAWSEVERVLRPDGVVIVSVPFYFKVHGYPDDYWRLTPSGMRTLLGGFPNRIVGTQGEPRRPMHVWGIGFGAERPAPSAEQLERFGTLLRQHAREPLGWPKRLAYGAGRMLFGGRIFAPWLEIGRCEWSAELAGPIPTENNEE